MGIKVEFWCDHHGCAERYVMDSAGEHRCEDNYPVEVNVPVDLAPVVQFLTDDAVSGGRGWAVAVDRMRSGLLVLRKCFCAAHADDVHGMPEYEPPGEAH